MAGTSTYNQVKNTSIGKAWVQSFLFTTSGAVKYNEAISKHVDEGKAVFDAIVYGTANRLSGGTISIVESILKKARLHTDKKK